MSAFNPELYNLLPVGPEKSHLISLSLSLPYLQSKATKRNKKQETKGVGCCFLVFLEFLNFIFFFYTADSY